MRKLLIGLTAASFAIGGLLIACSSDDAAPSSNTTDSGTGTDSSTSSGQDSGSGNNDTTDAGSDGGACQTCSDFLENGPGANPACTTGSPSSKQLIDNWFTNCVCVSGANGCLAKCSDTCNTFAAPSDDCQTCFSTVCKDSLAACAADGVSDAGTDAGDAGH